MKKRFCEPKRGKTKAAHDAIGRRPPERWVRENDRADLEALLLKAEANA